MGILKELFYLHTMSTISILWLLALKPANSLPRGASRKRDLQGQRVSAQRGGAAGRAGVKNGVMREPIAFPPPDLPKALSDHAATSWRGLIYLSGGCDSPNGNEFLPDLGIFACTSLSDSFFSFDPSKYFDHFVDLPNLPRSRYRHTSTAVNNKIWIVGGRDLNDNLLDTVDVYDIDTNSWTSLPLPLSYQVSDQAAFARDGFIYVSGGYDQVYNEKSAVYRIDTGMSTSTLVIEDVAPMIVARGDISVAQDSQYAYVAGGFQSPFCEALATVERYDFESGVWELLSDLVDSRADFGMVALGGVLLAFGGEGLVEGACDGPVTSPENIITAKDSVEVLGPDGFVDVGLKLDSHRFRFASVAWENTKSVYTFGGQQPYDAACQCYATSKSIYGYTKLYEAARNVISTPNPTVSPTQAPTTSPPVPAPTDDPGFVLTTGNDLCENAAELKVLAAGLGRFELA